MKHALLVSLTTIALLAGTTSAQGPEATVTAATSHARGVDFHLQRRLDEASREYAAVLTREPARPPTADEVAIVRRLAPRVFTTPSEFFGLKDAAAVLHPSERLIAYHLFWEDDIDFPEDNDPCDHELVWVRYRPGGMAIERFWTYFHGRLLDGGEVALNDARANEQRPRVDVQWGKHGSLPFGWQQQRIVADAGDIERDYTGQGPLTLLDYNRATWKKLTSEGRRLKEHPLARRLGWPERFDGAFEQFTDFSKSIDLVGMLDRQKLVAVSRWNSAVINQQFLAYNFRPKTEWPDDAATTDRRDVSAPVRLVTAASLDSFELPAKTVFDTTMPRYPNVWFYVDTSLAPSYDHAIRLVAAEVRGSMRMRESHGPFGNTEGCDFEVGIEHLQPWQAPDHRELQHAHAFHMRYYHSSLTKAQLERVTLATSSGPRQFYRVAASAHYEVEHNNPHHADVEICPVCGRTGDYAHVKGNLVEQVHDPLGLELLFDGAIRKQPISFEDDQPRPVGGVGLWASRYTIERHVFEAATGDRNTLRIGVVVMAPRSR